MKQFGVAAKAIIYNTDNKEYLVVRKSETEDINPDIFNMPGGWIEFS